MQTCNEIDNTLERRKTNIYHHDHLHTRAVVVGIYGIVGVVEGVGDVAVGVDEDVGLTVLALVIILIILAEFTMKRSDYLQKRSCYTCSAALTTKPFPLWFGNDVSGTG